MLDVDASGISELANAAAERIFGYGAGELTGAPVAVLESAEIDAALRPALAAPITYDPLHARALGSEPTGRCRVGSTIAIDIVSKVIPAGAGRKMLISVMDSEARRRLAARRPALAFPINEELDSPLLAQAPTFLGRWRLDLGNNELTWSDEMFRIYGLPLVNGPVFEDALSSYADEDRERIRALRQRAITQGLAYRDEARIVRPNGLLRQVVVSGEAQLGPDGKPVAVTGTTEDVTELRNSQVQREAPRQLMSAADAAGKVGMWELDLQTNVSAWDKNMYPIYGLHDTNAVPCFEL